MTGSRSGVSLSGSLGSLALMGAVKSAALTEGREHHGITPHVIPFVTISRQAGAGGHTLATKLAALMTDVDRPGPSEAHWAVWDQELVEKVARDHGLDEAAVATLEEGHHPWFADLLAGLVGQDPAKPDEFKVYKRVAAAIRGLARLGRAVIVGRGGAFITRDLPGGIHIRLIAPRTVRVSHMASLLHISEADAARKVDQLDHDREAFYRRYWPSASLSPDRFTLTINTAGLNEETLAEVVKPLIVAGLPAGTMVPY
ncbi:cytidylate kinase-like family protein [Humisphaera borealis]|uniref:Cytidylate kinase-like family protein n=1 Tax=Humisphaera borealis TaxID=2807512 RepID=A0A7M2WU31_9BACT|nr:cytidylate kinase-like family protein [Humisphaera borealis]QOV88959.1 cytidylate kinase-like family protein [Humisphaera borealis]